MGNVFFHQLFSCSDNKGVFTINVGEKEWSYCHYSINGSKKGNSPPSGLWVSFTNSYFLPLRMLYIICTQSVLF